LFLLCFTRWLLELIFYAVTSLKLASYGKASAATLFTNDFPSDFDLIKKKASEMYKVPQKQPICDVQCTLFRTYISLLHGYENWACLICLGLQEQNRMVVVDSSAPSCTFGPMGERECEVGKNCVDYFVHITGTSLPAVRCTQSMYSFCYFTLHVIAIFRELTTKYH